MIGHAPSANDATPSWALDVGAATLLLATNAATVTYACVREQAVRLAMADLQLCGLTASLAAVAPLGDEPGPGR